MKIKLNRNEIFKIAKLKTFPYLYFFQKDIAALELLMEAFSLLMHNSLLFWNFLFVLLFFTKQVKTWTFKRRQTFQ